jgi:ElaB/YqjD/DUF883 family membrane-anchored ribosome-binding protein
MIEKEAIENGNGHHSSKAGTKAHETAEVQTPSMEEVIESVTSGAEELLVELKTKVEKTVREYPIQSVAVCVGVGYLLGALWASKRK